MTKNLFWTGGFDSTFRLLQLIEDPKVSLINLFFLALNIDNIEETSLKRRSVKNEIESINKVLKIIDTTKINKLNIFGPHKNLIEYKFILDDFKFLNFIIRDEINYSDDLKNAYSKLFDMDIVPREKSQYGAITQIMNELDITAEVCIEKDGGLYNQISQFVEINGDLSKKIEGSELGEVFKRYNMPLFWIDKKNMLEESSLKKWTHILSETWTCWYPVKDKQCGLCFACQRRPFLYKKFDISINKNEIIDNIYNIKNNFNYFTDYEIDFLSKEYDEINSFKKNISYQEKNKMKVTANIATQPKRFWNLLATLESIKNQFDEIRIYLNNYTEVPHELSKYTTFIGKDLTDNGKMFWSNNPNEYYFTLDDDIIYPPDYVEKTLPLIEDRIVSYHGLKLMGTGQSYYNSNIYYSHKKRLNKEKYLEVGGTGVMAFNTNIFKPTLWRTPIKKMCDLLISLEASLYNIPIVILPHSSNWIRNSFDISSGKKVEGIYDEFMLNDNKQSIISDMIQLYKQSQFRDKDNLIIAGSITKQDVYHLNDKIQKYKNDRNNFYHIGSGDGKLITQMSILSNFDKYIGIETISERIKFSDSIKENLKIENIEFKKSNLDEISIEENSVVYLNDITMNLEETKKTWNKLPIGSILLCSNIIPNIFPIDKITIQTSWNKFLKKDILLYLKS